MIDEITGESRDKAACYTNGSGDEINDELFFITFKVSVKRKPIIHVLFGDATIVGSSKNSTYETL